MISLPTLMSGEHHSPRSLRRSRTRILSPVKTTGYLASVEAMEPTAVADRSPRGDPGAP
jgi:hypothetical protein